MSYLGNSPGVGSFIVSTERFNGTGSCTQFTITQTGIQDANTIDVIVSSVQQDPINSYSVANGVITFTEAPPAGTQNITVRYRATTVITYNSIQTAQIADGSITATKIASGVLPSAAANSAALYANAAFAAANTATSSGSYANSAFLAANTPSYTANSAASYANSAFLTANNSLAIDTTQNTNITAASSYANSGFLVANSAASYANSGFTKANNALTAGANTTTSVQFGSLGIGTAASGTTGEIRATNEVTAYYSSDARLKENVQTIENALDKLRQLNGVMFDWTEEVILQRGGEDGYFVRKHDTGLIAQQVEEVLPEVVADRQDGYKAIKYEKMAGLIIQGINELSDEIKIIKERLARHGIT
jgi:hypothetical protein